MARIKNGKHSPRTRERNGVLSDVERFFFFLCGTIVGAVARRATAPRETANKEIAVAEPANREIKPPSALPQTDSWSEIPAHEKSDANLPALGMVLLVLVVGAFVIHASLWWWVNLPGASSIDEATRWQVIAARVPEPQKDFPQLQRSPQRDLQDFLATGKLQLHGVPPANQTNATVRMPIERAMNLVAERGLPKWRAEQEPISPLELQQRRAVEPQKELK